MTVHRNQTNVTLNKPILCKYMYFKPRETSLYVRFLVIKKNVIKKLHDRSDGFSFYHFGEKYNIIMIMFLL
jgi:hypothetical protein